MKALILKKTKIVFLLAPLFYGTEVLAACTISNNTITTDNTLYYCGDVSKGENIVVSTTADASISPLKGYGVYNQSGTINSASITTIGSQSDAIMQRSSKTLTIGDNLYLKTTGSSADGINLAISGASTLTVGNNMTVDVASGVGIRSNLSTASSSGNILIVGDNAKITTAGSGSNEGDSVGYAVYAGNRDRETVGIPTVGSAKITMGDNSTLTTSGSEAYAVYANKTGIIQLGSTSIKTIGTNAHGIVTKNGSIGKCPASGFSSYWCLWTGSGLTNVTDYSGGQVYLTGDTTITVDTSNGSYAMYSSGDGSLISSSDSDGNQKSGIYTVTGSLVADSKGKIDLVTNSSSQFIKNDTLSDGDGTLISLTMSGTTMSNSLNEGSLSNITAKNSGAISIVSDASSNISASLTAINAGVITFTGTSKSYLEGISTLDDTSTINMSLSDSAIWQLTGDSTVSSLALNNNGTIILGDDTGATKTVFKTTTLSGSGGKIVLDSYISHDENAIIDTFHVTGVDGASGDHYVYVRDHNTGGANVDGSERTVTILTEGGDATFSLSSEHTSGTVDVGAYKYILVRGDEKYTAESGERVTDWVLVAKKENSKPVPTDPAQNSVNVLHSSYLMSYIENQTLLQRMGQLRQGQCGESGDVWGRIYGGKLNSFGDKRLSGFGMDYYGIQLGVDRKYFIENADVYYGIMAGIGRGSIDYSVGSGVTKRYYLGLYGTYKHDNGLYLDGLVKYGRMNNKFNTKTGGGYLVKGNGDTQGFVLGMESGKRFYLSLADNNDGWYVEPQGQLTYSYQNSAVIKSSNGLRTKLNSYNSLLGRASIIVGYTVLNDENPIDIYLKTGYVREFAGETSYTFNHVNKEKFSFKGNWWDNGIGINMQVNKQHNVYADVVYSIGSKFDQKQINAGYRYNF